MPKTVGLVGYGAVGSSFADLVLENHPNVNFVALDIFDFPKDKKMPKNFRYIKEKVVKENVANIPKIMGLKPGDICIDLSVNIYVHELFENMNKHDVHYINTACEEWDTEFIATSYNKSAENMYESSIGYLHDVVEKSDAWKRKNGPTSIYEFGMNPGLVSHCTKLGLLDAANYFLTRPDFTDLDHNAIRKYLKEKNFPKLAQALKLHTVHCSEKDT